MWRIDSLVTFAVIAPMLLVVVITQRITAGIHKYSRVAREAGARVTSFVASVHRGAGDPGRGRRAQVSVVSRR